MCSNANPHLPKLNTIGLLRLVYVQEYWIKNNKQQKKNIKSHLRHKERANSRATRTTRQRWKRKRRETTAAHALRSFTPQWIIVYIFFRVFVFGHMQFKIGFGRIAHRQFSSLSNWRVAMQSSTGRRLTGLKQLMTIKTFNLSFGRFRSVFFHVFVLPRVIIIWNVLAWNGINKELKEMVVPAQYSITHIFCIIIFIIFDELVKSEKNAHTHYTMM